ncbi:uncharacterized protein L3040_007421 [Drepanopeziza brunnea f. sp. 'multigermtubi']|uniref:uncharacterized protein n=1 Tax=Drepanopeziza brunnea f. sp. 'multigermtubi' TaxID=698441 RepID=UPI00238F02BA|nr:hypothetical protein L3040_007421 [Drepanopeziza brunnea f. sp. 'multigermtubi']
MASSYINIGLPTSILLAVASLGVDAAFKPPINNTLEQSVETECKTCPYSLCTNKAFYEYDTQVSLVCWTTGAEIDGDTTWLRTSDDCYVTEYDLMDISPVDYQTALSYCGSASEELLLTYDNATVKYDAECNICPDNASCETIKYLRPGTNVTVTCWTADGEAVIGDTTWLKTTDNCYVNELHLTEPANRTVLDNCGPIGFVQVRQTDNTAGVAASSAAAPANEPMPEPVSSSTSTVRDRRHSPARAPTPIPELPLAEAAGSESALHKRYLINITVGADSAACHSATASTSAVETRYPLDAVVWMQCYATSNDSSTTMDRAEQYWYLTTDFCYVREEDFRESLFDQYRFPRCSLFE